MGTTQGSLNSKRERTESTGAGRRVTSALSDDDSAAAGGLELKIGRGSPNSSMHSMQFENSSEYPVVVKYTGNAKHVSICGSWDGWRRKIPLVKSSDDFATIINLPEGRHEFKFNVDGRWICDHNLPRTAAAEGGGGGGGAPQTAPGGPGAGGSPATGESNLIVIDKADFEVFDALDKDLQSSGPSGGGGEGSDGKSSEAEKVYAQDIPDRRVFEKTAQPPVLPPHLLQVILNKDTPISCDPNVLPEPNHVMLNHLYALSIKDGVMVLSATHRYRKKYVTTLLYKPI